jgi:hypothetical protein
MPLLTPAHAIERPRKLDVTMGLDWKPVAPENPMSEANELFHHVEEGTGAYYPLHQHPQ